MRDGLVFGSYTNISIDKLIVLDLTGSTTFKFKAIAVK
jgi:hypothetical protein